MWNRNVAVGIFVIAGTALFALAIFLIGGQNSVFTKHIELYTEFRNLNGLGKGAKVRVGGFDAGEVKEITVPDSPSAGFRLRLEISESASALVRTDSVAVIDTEGVVGDKYVLIATGSPAAPKATSFSKIEGRETSDMAALVQKGAALLDDANETMKVVSGRLTSTLDSVTTTVDDANDLIVGLKQGRGAIGMLLNDEQTAADIRQAVANVRDATSALNHASGKADALVSDFQSRGLGEKVDAMVSDLQSRNLGEKLDQTLDNVHSAASNIDGTSRQLQEALNKTLSPDGQGRDLTDNIRETLSNVNEATANMADDTEALKHEFFFRGFFKKRGYFSLARLEPEKYRQDKVFANSKNKRAWIEASDLFEQKQGEAEALSRAGKRRIDAEVAELGDAALGRVIVVEGYAASGTPGDEMALSRTRAILVRNYLHSRFQFDSQNIGAVPLRAVPPPGTRKESWNGICIVLLAQQAG